MYDISPKTVVRIVTDDASDVVTTIKEFFRENDFSFAEKEAIALDLKQNGRHTGGGAAIEYRVELEFPQ